MPPPISVAQYLDVEETTTAEWPDNMRVIGSFLNLSLMAHEKLATIS
jgi:hypothetical protein